MKIADWMNGNKTGTAVLIAGAGALAFVTMAQSGCSNLGDWIKVNVPRDVQKETGVPAKVPLNEAEYVRTEYVENAARTIAQFDEAINQADAFRDFTADLLDTGLTIGSDSLAGSGVPLGGFGAMALGGLGGLFLRRPGTAKEVKAAEDYGRERGRRETIEALKEAN